MKTQIYAAPAVKGLKMLKIKRDINDQSARFEKPPFWQIWKFFHPRDSYYILFQSIASVGYKQTSLLALSYVGLYHLMSLEWLTLFSIC